MKNTDAQLIMTQAEFDDFIRDALRNPGTVDANLALAFVGTLGGTVSRKLPCALAFQARQLLLAGGTLLLDHAIGFVGVHRAVFSHPNLRRRSATHKL